jgi:aryl-alcohol dehydrogenase-like predicted oxidoreductase
MQAYGLGLIPYFPLASGLLTGKYKRNAPLPEGTRLANTPRLASRYINEENWDKLDRLEEFCRARGRTLIELAFSWLLARPPVATVIAGATRPEQVEQNVAAAQWELSPEDLAEIDRLLAPEA